MAYYRRSKFTGGGGGGGNGGLFSRLFGNSAASINTPNQGVSPLDDPSLLAGGDFSGEVGPGSVPYQYKGNPEDILGRGGYVTPQGRFSEQPYSDTRNFWSKIGGEPNTAEQLNLELAQSGLLGRQTNELALAKMRAETPIKAEQELNAAGAALGLTPEQTRVLSPDTLNTLISQHVATRAKAAEEVAKATTGTQTEDRTRGQRVRTAVNEAQVGLNRSTQRALQSGRPEFAQATRAGLQAQEMSPEFALKNLMTTKLAPGETEVFDSSRLPRALTLDLGPSTIGQGMTHEQIEVPGPEIAPGVRAPSKFHTIMHPAVLREAANPDIVRSVLGANTPPISGMLQGANTGASAGLPSVAAPPSQVNRSVSPETIYDFPPHIAAQLNDPRYSPDQKAAIIKQYYQSLIEQAGPNATDILSNFLGNDVNYNTKLLEQERRRKLLTPNY